MKNVLILADSDRGYFSAAENLLAKEGICYIYGDPMKIGEEDLITQAKGARTVIAGSENWSRYVMEHCPELKLIVRCGTGYDGVDVKAAAELGIQVGNTPGLNTYAVAEMALSLMLALQRKVVCYHGNLQKGIWGPMPARELRGKTIGLLGFGGIAKHLAALLQPFQCRILAFDICKDKETAERLGVEFAELEVVMGEADVLSLHLPLLKDTKHLICRESIGRMKPGALLINTSRGGIIKTEDLFCSLKEGRIGGAALDVHEVEPIPESYCMKGMPNVILTPHAASATEEATRAMIEASVRSVAAYYKIGRGNHLVNE